MNAEDRTEMGSGPPADPNRTQPIPPLPESGRIEGQPPASSQNLQEENLRLATELARRGIPPEEINRLLSLGAAPHAPQAPAQPEPTQAAPRKAFQPRPTITLPEFRPVSDAEKAQADRLLIQANIARRRNRYTEAERLCREAIEYTPSDAAALELYGDILQSIGRVDDALYAYDRARTADPNRSSAERKYAQLTLAQETDILSGAEGAAHRNPSLAVFLSATLPGAGQVYNGQAAKGLAIALAELLAVYLWLWTPLRNPTGHPNLTAALVALAAVVYIYAVADANIGARQAGRSKSGWEV
ncbi:MAG: tetratricopeptide repeat protein [Chthonomonadales bacterium]